MTVVWRFWCFWCFPPLGVAPLLVWTSGSFVGVNQWLPCWGEPMAGAPPSRARPFGARWAGPRLLCVGWKYRKSSHEKVSRKTTLCFLLKLRFWSFYLSKRSETYLERQISSRQSGSNFLSKIDWRTLQLWHFFSTLHFILFLLIYFFCLCPP